MRRREMPSPELLRELLRYDAETGTLYWRKCTERRGRAAAGAEAFTAVNYGYRVGSILYHYTSAHRVAWAIYHGRWPENQIDHINGIRDDNRLVNLREVTDGENKLNMKLRSDNLSGAVGVYWHSQGNKWRAEIKKNRKRQHLGTFDRKEDAIAARKEAEKRLGFHRNHGRVTA